ncbi:AraC family transcriptional regulator ligand-binding domain-containing protein [Paraneptunicella aestuarii]|uniref:AraC family transcriptional regulator n=1 Tax=Paraneptunicella aestuarii TaxID=2831148 RepID=UPI001E49C67F|nr:AraC family transcriptional regulator [Paraneptunicella aestuarii]UAA40042.1 AraC family transcriptional regulator ligand-binding domain-containing protein [Paraneptunicella aestuarii]
MPKIALDTVRSLINYLSVKGIDRDILLAKTGLSEKQLNQSGELVSTTIYESLYQLAENKLQCKTIGFDFGKVIEPDRWGVLGYIAYTAQSVKSALENQRKYQTLVGNLGAPLQEVQEDYILLKWMPAYHCSHNTVEEIITGWVALAKHLTNNKIRPQAIYFSHRCQSDLQQFKDYFGCDVQFEWDYHGIKVDKSLASTPFTKHEPEIHNLLCQHAGKMVNNLAERLPVEIVTKFITTQLPLGVPEIEDAAQNLQISVRTLQRKLSEHQLTFTGLIDSIRKDLALSYLRNTNTKIVYIAQMLGFSEQSAFQRAFKRWTDQTPKQFRDSCLKG